MRYRVDARRIHSSNTLTDVYRIISFIMLGAILLVVSYFYQQSQQRAFTEEAKPAHQAEV